MFLYNDNQRHRFRVVYHVCYRYLSSCITYLCNDSEINESIVFEENIRAFLNHASN